MGHSQPPRSAVLELVSRGLRARPAGDGGLMHSASPVSSQSAPELFGVYRHHLALVTHLARAGGRYAGPERTLAAQAMALVARTQPRWFN